MRWPWESKSTKIAEPTVPIHSEEVETVKNQLEDWQRRLEVVEQRIKRPPTAPAR